jgi:hypothetical protein
MLFEVFLVDRFVEDVVVALKDPDTKYYGSEETLHSTSGNVLNSLAQFLQISFSVLKPSVTTLKRYQQAVALERYRSRS